MDREIEAIKKWLGNGSINIFGMPYSGKDTIGSALANMLGADMLSSGHLLRNYGEKVQEAGVLSPTEVFYDVVLPAFYDKNYSDKPLILSSIGRWHGEEYRVIETAKKSEHPIKAVLYVEITEDEIYRRLNAAYEIGDRSGRFDDTREIIKTRLNEFNEKTLPVIKTYRDMGLLIDIDGMGEREKVMERVVKKLFIFAKANMKLYG